MVDGKIDLRSFRASAQLSLERQGEDLGVFQVQPNLVASIRQFADGEAAYAISQPISALVALQSGLDGFLAVEKYLLFKQGVFKNTIVRGPVGFKLDEETRQEVDRLFELLQRVVGS